MKLKAKARFSSINKYDFKINVSFSAPKAPESSLFSQTIQNQSKLVNRPKYSLPLSLIDVIINIVIMRFKKTVILLKNHNYHPNN